MPYLNLKANSQPVQTFYREIKEKQQLSFLHEGAVAPHFSKLLQYCGRQFNWTLIEQYPIARLGRHPLKADGALLDEFKLVHGLWEAKDTQDDLPTEAKKKFQADYPPDNILFQAPDRAILYQNGSQVIDADITKPPELIDTLKLFFEYQPPAYEQWELAVDEFRDKVPELARSLLHLIEEERKYNKRFVQALDDFTELVRQAINPNIALSAVEEMLIQHLLTERIFRRVFDNPDFANRNIIAVEIEKVIQALTSRHFSRSDFLSKLDRFYGAIETTAATIDDFAQKQDFLNTVYEKFFQGFSIKVADTHGIVYTPQPIVEFMVRSVDDILQKEFHKSLGHRDVHILDPFVGTGNFILRIMQHIPKTLLPHKYTHELHCNEVMLLPYYIAAMNIEHAYFELTGQYQPFEGICMVDTFELAEGKQMSMFAKGNTERVERQKQAPIFVIIGNPPYNAHQVNENDNSKNRKYPYLDRRVAETYAKDSAATNKNALSDVYVKAIRWATDRIGDEGIVAFVTNNSFVDQIAFDGMRKHLEQDFDDIYILDLGGNVRKNPKLSGTTHNVFGIQVGVSINIFVRKRKT
jgi:predicted helicase